MNTNLPIMTKNVFLAQTVGAGTSVTSPAIQLQNALSNGYFSIQLAMTGDGSLALAYEISIDGVNFMTPSTGSAITAAFTKTSGANADGKDILSFTPLLATAIRFKATATTSDVVLTANVCMQ